MNDAIRKALLKSSKPAARRKAVATMAASRELAARFDVKATAFNSAVKLRKFMERHKLGLGDVPPELHARLGKRALAKLANGHTRIPGIGIPLEAIPERKTNSVRAAPNGGTGNYPRAKGHPNAELIGKILDMLGKPDTTDAVAERLGKALDKLI